MEILGSKSEGRVRSTTCHKHTKESRGRGRVQTRCRMPLGSKHVGLRDNGEDVVRHTARTLSTWSVQFF